MKKYLLTVLLSVSFLAIFAQDNHLSNEKDTSGIKPDCKNYLVMKDGIIIYVKNGTAFAFTDPMVLKNGISVQLNGIYSVQGRQKLFMDGDSLYLNGRVVVNKNRAPFQKTENEY
jgi:hypothetical protein